jgi:transposase-like protein
MRAPVVMVGDGALGLWRALREVFPTTREQRCWQHVTRNVLNALPTSVQAGARRALNEIILAEDRSHAERAIEAFAGDYGVKWPKAVAKVTGEAERLLCYFDYPAEHWVHLRTTNPIDSSFSPVRARTRVTKGPGTRDTGLAMVFKLLQAAEGRWRAVNGPHLVALVRAGARFEKGKLIERSDERPDKEAGEGVNKVAA